MNRTQTDIIDQEVATRPNLAPGVYPEVKEKEIALMFSGGVDSTATAIMLAEHYDKVHLVTYKNGYGHYYHHRTRKRVDELNKALGDKFIYTLMSVSYTHLTLPTIYSV